MKKNVNRQCLVLFSVMFVLGAQGVSFGQTYIPFHAPRNDFNTLDAAGNDDPTGIWSDGTTMWVADDSDDKIFAYDMATKARDAGKDFDTLRAAGNYDPEGIWSDGTTMWVADDRDNKIYAYDMASKARDPGKDFDALDDVGNTSPTGIWSDGTTMWVADEWDEKIYAYNISTGAPDPDKDFNTLGAAENENPEGIWSDGTTMWVADDSDDKIYAYDMASKARDPGRDLNLDAAPIRVPQGIWSDGTTMWVADYSRSKIYVYDMATAVWHPRKDFETLDAAGNDDPTGIWSDGTTMWVADDSDDKIFAYDVATKARDAGKDFDTLRAAGNNDPEGIWSDGTTMWVADDRDDKIYAYDVATKARDTAKDFNTLDSAGNHTPQGIWSDGTMMWVVDDWDDKIYAYNMLDNRTGVSPPVDPATPDLLVQSPTVSDGSPDAGASITLRVTVVNRGSAQSSATTLRFYRSPDATVSTSDTEIGSRAVSALAASGSSNHSIALTAPSAPGVYYYGACVQNVNDESNTANNCSPAVTVTVTAGPSVPQMYWNHVNYKIQSANLDGSNVKDVLVTGPSGQSGSWGLAVDVRNGKLYWTDWVAERIRRADLDGTNVEDLVTSADGLDRPVGLALDVGNSKMYWTDWDSRPMNTHACYHTCALISIVVMITLGSNRAGYGQSSADATLSGLTVSPVDVAGFSNDVTHYDVGVADSVTQVTVTVTAADSRATIQIRRSDHTVLGSGPNQIVQDVSLDEGANRLFIWVTSYGGNTRKTFTIVVGRGVDDAFGWKAAGDFNTLEAAGNRSPEGIWSDGATMWVADEEDAKLYAYDMRTKARDAAKDFNTLAAAGNESPHGIWSDGTTMWVADGSDRKLYAYNMSTKARDASREVDRETAGGGNLHPKGIWSDGTTMWVAYYFGASGEGKLCAHTMETKSRDGAKDFNTLQAAGNEHPEGIWSDGATIWVSDDRKLYAYDLSTKARTEALDFNTLEEAYDVRFGMVGQFGPRGIWSDGATMWVADASGSGKIFSFNMPPSANATLKALGISPVDIEGFAFDVFDYHIGVANAVSQVTVTPYLSDEGATIDVNGSTASSGSGHTVPLAEGRNEIAITVTAQDGTTTREYNIAADRGSNAPFGWKVTEDFPVHIGFTEPYGIWSDGTTMWVMHTSFFFWRVPGVISEYTTLQAYAMSTKEQGVSFHTLKTWGNDDPLGITSDGTTMWVADHYDGKIYAYRMSNYSRNPSKEINDLALAGITMPKGIAVEPVSDGFWVADDADDKLYAYNRHTLGRIPDADFNTLAAAGNNNPSGIWTDGTTMWVADSLDAKLYAYDMGSKAHVPSKDFNTLSAVGNNRPWGIWSDGETMWVADWRDRIFSYTMPNRTDATLREMTVIPEDIADFSPGVTAYHVGVASDVAQLWVMPTVNQPGATIDIDGTTIISGAAHSISLSEGRNDVVIAVTADDGRTTRDYSVTVGRSVNTDYGWNTVEDFNALNAADNDYPTGVWSDGTTMWVADAADKEIYAYNLNTKARDDAKDISALDAAGNTSPRGLWSDGTTMWVADPTDDKLYAYSLSTAARDASKDFSGLGAAGNEHPAGIWSDGTTMWVVDTQDDKIYAYDLATKARDSARDFDALNTTSGGNRTLGGIWSDGSTMWLVVDRGVHAVGDDKVYAFDMGTRTRDSTRDFEGLDAAGNEEPFGIWSDGVTLWVANYEQRSYTDAGDRVRYYSAKIYAYNMPSNGGTATAATDFNGDGRTDFADFFLFADAYGGTDAKFDLDGSGTVDFADFFKFVDAFGS